MASAKQTLKDLPDEARTVMAKETVAARPGAGPTRRELDEEARRLGIAGRSKMGKAELERAVSRAKSR